MTRVPSLIARAPRALIVFVIAALAGLAGLWYLGLGASRVATDNAYVKADIAVIAPKVHGLVAEVLVHDNEPVAAGQPLARIDDQDYRAALRAAEADWARARAGVAAAKAARLRHDAERDLAAASVREAEARIGAADAERGRTRADHARYVPLTLAGFASHQKLELTEAGARAAAAEAVRARAGLDVARRQASVVDHRGAELDAQIADAEAIAAKAEASLDLARQDLEHTVIRAPFAGVIGDRHVERGEYVQVGARLMAVVPLDALYLVANFKETQTAGMRPGQTARIEVDALPGQALTGVVDSLAPASGSEFALLPFEPGTGNFTKIVQRVPVRIRLDGGPAVAALRPGLSATVTVALR